MRNARQAGYFHARSQDSLGGWIGCGKCVELGVARLGRLLMPRGGAVTAVVSTRKFRMPSIYRPKNEWVFRCKVGYEKSRDGRSWRRGFRLGPSSLQAHKNALGIGEACFAKIACVWSLAMGGAAWRILFTRSAVGSARQDEHASRALALGLNRLPIENDPPGVAGW